MKIDSSRPTATIGLLAGPALLIFVAGCAAENPSRHTAYWGRPTERGQAKVAFADGYDYYPRYEVYHSRHRREYVYREGNHWVRRSEPRGVAIDVLHSAPSVRVNFRDSPAPHHADVARSFPKNWQRPTIIMQVQPADTKKSF